MSYSGSEKACLVCGRSLADVRPLEALAHIRSCQQRLDDRSRFQASLNERRTPPAKSGAE